MDMINFNSIESSSNICLAKETMGANKVNKSMKNSLNNQQQSTQSSLAEFSNSHSIHSDTRNSVNSNNCDHRLNRHDQNNSLHYTAIRGLSMVSLLIDGKERVCLAQISNTLLKRFSYNEIHNRRVALGINCIQCTPLQLDLLRNAGAMPISSRRCGMITKREAERLVNSFLDENKPLALPDNFSFDIQHKCGFGCKGIFFPSRYNSSRAKCIRCFYCGIFFSPNKFIFHMHETPNSKFTKSETANFNSWRRHITLINEKGIEELNNAWEDVKSIFNGGKRKRNQNSPNSSDQEESDNSIWEVSYSDCESNSRTKNKSSDRLYCKQNNLDQENEKDSEIDEESIPKKSNHQTNSFNEETFFNDFMQPQMKYPINEFFNPFLTNKPFNLTNLMPDFLALNHNLLINSSRCNIPFLNQQSNLYLKAEEILKQTITNTLSSMNSEKKISEKNFTNSETKIHQNMKSTNINNLITDNTSKNIINNNQIMFSQDRNEDIKRKYDACILNETISDSEKEKSNIYQINKDTMNQSSKKYTNKMNKSITKDDSDKNKILSELENSNKSAFKPIEKKSKIFSIVDHLD